MGAGASKTAPKAAAAAGRRQYPSTSSILNSATSTSNNPSDTASSNTVTTTTTTSSSSSPPPSASSTPTSPGPPSSSQVHPNPSTSPPSSTKSAHIDLDGRDPDFGASLRKLGPAIPVARAPPHSLPSSTFPTSSHPPPTQRGNNNTPGTSVFPSQSPSSNPAIMIVQTRERIARQFETESESLGRPSFAGRTLVTAKDISEAIRLRDERGIRAEEVEKSMRLAKGVMDRLGPRGMVANAGA